MNKDAKVKKLLICILTVLLTLSVTLIALVSCGKMDNVSYSVVEIGYSRSTHVANGEYAVLDVPYYAGHYFIQYEDADGVAYTDSSGKLLEPFAGDKLNLFGKYGEIVYTLRLSVNTAEGEKVSQATSGFFNNASRSSYSLDNEMPELPIPTKEHYHFLGWYYLNQYDEQVLITDGNGSYLDGFDTLNGDHYYLTGTKKYESFYLYAAFEVNTYSVTFEYFENGQQVTEMLSVPEAQYLDEVAPIYVDSDGNEHMRSWYLKDKTASLDDDSKYNNKYVGYTAEGLEVYALDGLYIRKHFCENVDYNFKQYKNTYYPDLEYGRTDGSPSSPYIYEFYTLDADNRATSYFYMENIYAHGTTSSGTQVTVSSDSAGVLEIHRNVKEAFIVDDSYTFYFTAATLNIESIHVAERSGDLTIHFQTKRCTVSNTGIKPLIDASEMSKEYTLTVIFEQEKLTSGSTSYSFVTENGANGATGYSYDDVYQTDDDEGGAGGTGYSGKSGCAVIVANTLVVASSGELPLLLQAGNGGNGGNGGQGENSNGPKSATGGEGGRGGGGGTGGSVFVIGNSITFDCLTDVTVIAGHGGDGGTGGRGGHGYGSALVIADDGGDGGNGGWGGDGGRAILFGTDADMTIHVRNVNGLSLRNGSGGNGGNGGKGGNGGAKAFLKDAGFAGKGGDGGNGGDTWRANYVFDQEIDATLTSGAVGFGGKPGAHGSDYYGRTNDDESFPPTDGLRGTIH